VLLTEAMREVLQPLWCKIKAITWLPVIFGGVNYSEVDCLPQICSGAK